MNTLPAAPIASATMDLGARTRARLLQLMRRELPPAAYYFQLRAHPLRSQPGTHRQAGWRNSQACALMERGVDLATFSPTHATAARRSVRHRLRRTVSRRRRRCAASPDLRARCRRPGLQPGEVRSSSDMGSDEQWLRQHIPRRRDDRRAARPGAQPRLREMDLFAFYSRPDTFGNVVLEALASGVPPWSAIKAVPSSSSSSGRSGFVCSSDEEFTASVLR